jgi:hypothetical protein
LQKTTKSADELSDMIMTEVRKHPECDAVQRIGIIRPATRNWDVTIIKARVRVCPPACHKILEATVQRLRALYDCSGKK